MVKKPLDYEKAQYKEQQETNLALWINTAATLGSFIFSIIMAWLLWNK